MPEPTEIDQQLARLYGDVDWRGARGVLHVAAIAATSHVVIAIGPHAPSSPTDRFVLGFVRARCDVIVTTGATLRAEPELVHRLSETPEEEAALRSWRERVLGRTEAPMLVVLSRSGDLPVDHPALAAAPGGFVWTSRQGRARMGAKRGPLEVVAEEGGGSGARSGIAAAIDFALSRAGVETVALEAGPSVSRALYPRGSSGASGRSVSLSSVPSDSPDRPAIEGRVDELLLSRFEGELPPDAIGAPFVPEPAIRARFPDAPTEVRVQEPSGGWRFQRYRRPGPV